MVCHGGNFDRHARKSAGSGVASPFSYPAVTHSQNDIYGGNPHDTLELVVSQIFCIPCSLDFFVAGIVVLPEFSHRKVEIPRRGKRAR